MTEVTVSVRVKRTVHDQMKANDDINWSAVIRKSIEGRLEEVNVIDHRRLEEACKSMDRLRKIGAFTKGRSSEVIIREWRDKRKF